MSKNLQQIVISLVAGLLLTFAANVLVTNVSTPQGDCREISESQGACPLLISEVGRRGFPFISFEDSELKSGFFLNWLIYSALSYFAIGTLKRRRAHTRD